MIESGARQLWLEIRRNEYRWLFLVVAIGTGLALTDRVSGSVVFWPDVTLAWRDAIYVLGPWTGAAAAWTAGRERRHGLEDLLLTTARPSFRRRIWSLAAVTLLGLLTFGLIGGWLALASIQRAAWGQIGWGAILIAGMGIAASALFGFAFGAWKPRRATAFATMIGLSLIQLILADGQGWTSFLTATPPVRSSAWTGITPNLHAEQFFFYAGLIALGLTLIATVDTRGWLNYVALAFSALLILLAVSSLVGQSDAIRAEVAAAVSPGSEPGAPHSGEYTMICSDGATIVCVHPAYRPMLDEASNQFSALLSAVDDLPETPTRINLLPIADAAAEPDVWSHAIGSTDPDADLRRAVHDLARELIAPASTAAGAKAQNSVLAWALIEAGRPLTCEGEEAIDSGAAFAPVDCDAVNRLVAQPSTDRDAWLTAHWNAIRSGTITLEELP